jgi:hypothetical protein
MAETPASAPTWRIVLAAILDFLTVFFVAGYTIAWSLGGLTGTGFKLTGFPALLLFAVLVAYFVLGKRVFGGTLWKRILGVVR